jgi:hypothetical protein
MLPVGEQRIELAAYLPKTAVISMSRVATENEAFSTAPNG